MTGSLIERVRERLASESGPLRWRIFVCCRQN